MATLASAKEKYIRKTANAAAKWNAAKGRMSANYPAGIAKFLGSPPAGHVVAAYQAGINSAQYKGGDADKWERNLRAALTGS